MKLRYTRRAATELDQVLADIDRASPLGAAKVKRRLFEVMLLLIDRPEAGQATSRGLRRFVAFPYPYVVFYRVETDWITIHAVRHAARRPLSD
ncbi:MAG TPA: type II toxin-antitoxin system RelE/ParE family toxin [Rhodoblastus sp.]|nr:type II toxin-antitoxin system RelE/ParE family toxin [Rhodoblastus sp.]